MSGCRETVEPTCALYDISTRKKIYDLTASERIYPTYGCVRFSAYGDLVYGSNDQRGT